MRSTASATSWSSIMETDGAGEAARPRARGPRRPQQPRLWSGTEPRRRDDDRALCVAVESRCRTRIAGVKAALGRPRPPGVGRRPGSHHSTARPANPNGVRAVSSAGAPRRTRHRCSAAVAVRPIAEPAATPGSLADHVERIPNGAEAVESLAATAFLVRRERSIPSAASTSRTSSTARTSTCADASGVRDGRCSRCPNRWPCTRLRCVGELQRRTRSSRGGGARCGSPRVVVAPAWHVRGWPRRPSMVARSAVCRPRVVAERGARWWRTSVTVGDRPVLR